MKTIAYVKYAAKALIAGATTFASGAAIASAGGWTQPEVWTVAGATVAAVGLVFGIGNGDKPEG